MTDKEVQYVNDVLEREGFDYTFHDYAYFSWISDTTFHKLRSAYLAARSALQEYIEYEE